MMGELLLVITLFVVSHMLPMYPPWRGHLVAVFGHRLFLLLYSLLSLALLYWLVIAYLRAPVVAVWYWREWTTWVPVVVMPLVTLLLVAGLTSPNPFSIGLGAKGYRSEAPGIVSITRQPLMWAFALWAGAHIPPNGEMAALILFAIFCLLSLAGTITVERARRRRYPVAQWQQWREGTANLPFCGQLPIDWRGIGVPRIVAAVGLYLLLLTLHERVIGIAPPLMRGG